eukprot:COSAG03_NODE_273_length_9568_cov_33.245644_10_plen_87_part_00
MVAATSLFFALRAWIFARVVCSARMLVGARFSHHGEKPTDTATRGVSLLGVGVAQGPLGKHLLPTWLLGAVCVCVCARLHNGTGAH